MYLNDYANIDVLVEKAKHGDNESFWNIFEFYTPVINSVISNVCEKYHTISRDDLFSECVFIVKDLCEKYDKDKSYFSYYLNTRLQPYLVAKIKSTYINSISILSLHSCDKDDLIEEIKIEFEDYSYLKDEIDKLPLRLKRAINLFYFDGLTQSECAVILKISQPAFSKQLSKALKILRENIKKWL